MSGTPDIFHCNSCLTKSKFSPDEVKNISVKDNVGLKENQCESIHNITNNIDINILREQNSIYDNNRKAFTKLNSDKNVSVADYSANERSKDCVNLSDKKQKKIDDTLSVNNKAEDKYLCDDKYLEVNKSEELINHNIDLNENASYITSHNPEMRAALSKVAHHLGFSSDTTESNQVYYYGVYIPTDATVQCDGQVLHVYTDKLEALKIMKQNKKARFKQLKSRKEAVAFATHGAEFQMEQTMCCATGGEKIMPFKCPKTQEMIKFRKAIECGDVDEVKALIWENPRYLVSNGDTPSILQEGCRYNALHIAAKSKNVEITQLILDSITSVEFIGHLYDDNDIASCQSRSEVLLDLYLNMPDKALNETPLHLAVKFGAGAVAEHLLSYPQCQRNLPNKHQLRPKDIVCSRVGGERHELKEAIAGMLEEKYFIPVLRYEDNSMQPRVGAAFSPNEPLKLEADPLSPRLEIQAYAGPMNKDAAESFKRKWKTPPRQARNMNSPSSLLRLCDVEKGLERIGRDLASEFKVPWKEFWSFLGTFVDLSSEEGLDMLENYLKRRFEETLELSIVHETNEESPRSPEQALSPMSDLCEAMKSCSLNDGQDLRRRRKHEIVIWDTERRGEMNKKGDEVFENDGNHPLLYVEKSCQVFGKRIATAIFHVCSSADIYEVNTDTLRDGLEPEVKHLQALITSYREDSRFQTVDFQYIHSRVATVTVLGLKELITEEERSQIILGLKEIDFSDGTVSDDEDFNSYYRNTTPEFSDPATNVPPGYSCLLKRKLALKWTTDVKAVEKFEGATTKQQLHCLIKQLIENITDLGPTPAILSTSARSEADCRALWALASPCTCSWNSSSFSRFRGNIKRKTLRFSIGCADKSPSKNVPSSKGDSFEEPIQKTEYRTEEDAFMTPPTQSSDSEDETMEDPLDLPDTFIFDGNQPTKTDFAVLDAIERCAVTPESHPNICRWRHLVWLNSRSASTEKHNASPGSGPRRHCMDGKRINFNDSFSAVSPSPSKILNQSFGSVDTPRRCSVQPWERVTGPYTPRRAMRALSNQESPMGR